jgi:hypothetical protein
MPIFAKGKWRCLFIHIPKTGGTSVEHAMRRLGWKESLIVHAAVSELRHFRVTPQHYHYEILNRIINWEHIDLTYTLCRHPFSRMKSEYYWQHEVGFTKDLSPEEWFNSVTERFSKDTSAFDNHIRPQIEFIPNNHPCEVYKLEDDGVSKTISTANALSPASWLNRRLRTVHSSWQQRATPVKRIENDFARLRNQIEEFYAIDMNHFGY